MKQVKNIYIGARTDQAQSDKIKQYVRAIKGMTMGEFMRRSADEYMENHPIKRLSQEKERLPESIKTLSGKE